MNFAKDFEIIVTRKKPSVKVWTPVPVPRLHLDVESARD